MYPSVLVLTKPDGSVWETGLPNLEVVTSWSQLLFWSLPSPSEPYFALLPPPLDFSLCRASPRHCPKTCSSALSSLDCPLVDRQRVPPSVLLARAGYQEPLLLPRKSDHPIWGSGPSDFLVLESCCLAGGRRVHNGRLLRSSLRSQNPQ
jgi:hypothetical protein